MPHLRLEYSSNIKERLDEIAGELFASCHQVLVDSIHTDPLSCQSRAVRCDLFYVGKGLPQGAFIYLEILLLEGR